MSTKGSAEDGQKKQDTPLEEIVRKTARFEDVTKTLGKKRVRKDKSLNQVGDAAAIAEARAQLKMAEAKVSLVSVFSGIADRIAFAERCTLTPELFEGALLLMIEKGTDAEAVAEYSAANARFTATRKPTKSGIKCYLTAPIIGSEFKKTAREKGLRFSELPYGFSGRGAMGDLVALAVKFTATLTVVGEDGPAAIVEAGVPDGALIKQIKAGIALPAEGAGGPRGRTGGDTVAAAAE